LLAKFHFEDSLESRAVILLARADGAGNFAMRPRERQESGKQDLFRSRLDQIIDMNHALVKLARAIEVRGGIQRQARPAATADAADGGAGDPQTQL
jgi:hypothetical protein